MKKPPRFGGMEECRYQKIDAVEQVEFPSALVALVVHPFFTRLDYTMWRIVRQSPQSPSLEALNGPRLFNSRNRSPLRGQLARCNHYMDFSFAPPNKLAAPVLETPRTRKHSGLGA